MPQFFLLRISNPNARSELQYSAPSSMYEEMLANRGWTSTCAAETTCDITGIADTIENLQAAPDRSQFGIVAEYTSDAPGSVLAHLCTQLKLLTGLPELRFLVISVPSVRILEETGMLDYVRNGRDSGVFVVDEEQSFAVAVSGLTYPVPSPIVRRPLERPDRELKPRDLKLRFGHYGANLDGRLLHTNVVPDLDAVERDRPAWRQLVASTRRRVAEVCGDADTAVILPIEWSGGVLERLVLELTHGDLSRVVPSGMKTVDLHAPHITLASAPLPASAHRHVAAERGAGTLSDFRHVNLIGASSDVIAVVELPAIAGAYEPWSCPYCQHSVPLEGSGYDFLATTYDPKTFWDLLAWDDSYVLTGHWRSPITPNHFNLKIEARPIFDVFAHSIAERITNALARAGVLAEWIDGVISTNGDESHELVPALAERLGVPDARVVRVDHTTRVVAGRPGVDSALTAWAAAYDEVLSGRNVILVDQAAHHLQTLSALRKVAAALSARPLAFAVFVDRTGYASEYLTPLYHGLHFIPLYSWSSPPWRDFECPCRLKAEIHL